MESEARKRSDSSISTQTKTVEYKVDLAKLDVLEYLPDVPEPLSWTPIVYGRPRVCSRLCPIFFSELDPRLRFPGQFPRGQSLGSDSAIPRPDRLAKVRSGCKGLRTTSSLVLYSPCSETVRLHLHATIRHRTASTFRWFLTVKFCTGTTTSLKLAVMTVEIGALFKLRHTSSQLTNFVLTLFMVVLMVSVG
ncbi:hypothetical protein SISSUDRAFT_136653 [Sistotremastrum suecicum HHB10207 ss-3]|uniref:Uncharacterized protein n=1 Tax=Sistotremastrum suecicum HHB10207 ss-3 TaxID=1314776 RepID=A0A166AUA2_9AGAM|nr:hypothetical protein SISSUDRAFT_136653 [Sistotremastrum suecicum HHB10207 ss-3]